MAITLPDQYPLLPGAGRGLVTVGNRIGSLGEYAQIVDRDTWLEANLSRRLICSVGSVDNSIASWRAYSTGDEIVRSFARLSQPTRGIRIVCWHIETASVGIPNTQIDYDIIDDDTSLSVGSGTFAASSLNVKDQADVTFTGASNIRVEIDAGGPGGSANRTNIWGIQIYELALTTAELP